MIDTALIQDAAKGSGSLIPFRGQFTNTSFRMPAPQGHWRFVWPLPVFLLVVQSLISKE